METYEMFLKWRGEIEAEEVAGGADVGGFIGVLER
jgi:hypothetical protein